MTEQPPYDDPRPADGALLPGQPPTPVPALPPTWGTTILPASELLDDGAKPVRPRRRSGVVIGAVATVVAVAAGAGAYAAMQLSGGGRQPETLAPATSFAFAKLDLDPAAGQKLAVRELMKKFPDAPQGELDEVFDEFLRTALQGDEDVDFDRDLDPWLGDRIGVAGFPGPKGEASVLGIIASKDDDAAEPALARLAAADDSDAAYLLRDGYVLVGADQASLDHAVASIGRGTLAESGNYSKDVAELTGDQILTAWVDAERSFEIAESMLGAEADAIPAELRKQIAGRFAVGVHADRNYLEIEGVSTEAPEAVSNGGKATLLSGLPATTVAVVSASGLGDAIGDQFDQALDAFSTFPGPGGMLSREDIAEAVEGATGLSLDEDLLPLLGDQMLLALGSVPDFETGEVPDLALMSLVADPASAARTARKIEALAAEQGAPLRARVVGSTFMLGTTDDYLGELGTAGAKLADTASFQRAVGDLGGDVAFVAYAELKELLTLMGGGETYEKVKRLSAVGVRAGTKDGRGYFRMRLVVE